MIICQLNYFRFYPSNIQYKDLVYICIKRCTKYKYGLPVDSKILKKEYKKDFRYLNANQIQEKIFQWLFNI